jgi:hypothetical protein
MAGVEPLDHIAAVPAKLAGGDYRSRARGRSHRLDRR